MKGIFHCVCALTLLMSGFIGIRPACAATNQPTGFRLTVELRDGSRIIGKSKEDEFKFHSDTLGDLKLPLQKIRFVESIGKTNLVKLTTSSKDSLVVAFAMKDVRVETAYAELKLPIALIKSLQVSVMGKTGRPKDGLIGLWSGEGDAVDSINGYNGTSQNVSFTDGVVGRAFSFNGNGFSRGGFVGVRIPDRPAFALTESLTIEGWVRPRGDGWVIMWRGDARSGMDPYALTMQNNHELRFEICSAENNTAFVTTSIPYGEWMHVAATLDGNAGTINLYTNGVLAAQKENHIRPIGELIADLSPGVGIGNVNDGVNNFPFAGDIDEIALYDRALSVDEINAIYSENAANAIGRAESVPSHNGRNYRQPSGIRNPAFNSN